MRGREERQGGIYSCEVNKQKPTRSACSTHYHQGKKMRGVLISEPGPDKTKCIEIWSVGQSAVDRVAVLADTQGTQGTAEEDLVNIHAAAAKRVKATSSKGKDGLRLATPRGFAAAGDDDADDLVIDSVFRRFIRVVTNVVP